MDLAVRNTLSTHSENITYNAEYTRGLTGVNVPLDHLLTQILCVSMGGICVLVLFGRIAQIAHAYLRRIISTVSTARQQTFWGVEESPFWAGMKKNFLYAPLGSKRHNREFRISAAVNVGTLPSRFHTLLLTVYVLSQVAYCTILDYKVNEKAALFAELRGRSGNLAVLNMIPLFLLAGRNNPLIPLLHVSFDTYNLMHRWIGRVVIIESVVHTLAWSANAVPIKGWAQTVYEARTDPFFTWGFVATFLMIILLFQSPSPIRHAFYETFLATHQLGALVIVIGVYLHLDIDNLPQVPWMILIIIFWASDRFLRFSRIVYLNFSRRHGRTKVVVKALPGEATRVTFHLPKRVRVPSGSHVYAYLPKISYWMSHPFSVAWVDNGISFTPRLPSPSPDDDGPSRSSSNANSPHSEKKQFEHLEAGRKTPKHQPTTVSLIMAARTGMTRKIHDLALSSPNSTFETTGFIEGPYTSHPSSFGSYGTVILFSGGAGITHHMLHVRDLLEMAAANTVATRRVYLVWSVRSLEHLAWVRGFMDEILQLPNRRNILVTKLFITKPSARQEVTSPSETLQMFTGRCKPDVVLEDILPDRVGATAVSVCGPGAFADEVRSAVRERLGKGIVIDFVEEAFTW